MYYNSSMHERLLDANLNRASEGLRVLEDVARFAVSSKEISSRIADIRHFLRIAYSEQTAALLSARDATGDPGAITEEQQSRTGSMPTLVTVNAKRVEEALRSLEEMSKIKSVIHGPAAKDLKKCRFELYDIEKILFGICLRAENRLKLKGLYVIIDPSVCVGDPIKITTLAIEGGAKVIQLRDKANEKGAQLVIARAIAKLTKGSGILFFVNDHLDLALSSGADGVHVGQKDMPLAEVRKIAPVGFMVGVSTNNVSEAKQAEADGADYVSVGRLFPTTSKHDTRPADLTRLQEIKRAVSVPVAAIGGINESNLPSVLKHGADMAAVISAVVSQKDVRGSAAKLAGMFKKELPKPKPIPSV
ncbi:MAG: thiamine phosphate synthase [Dehalococcoidia bacterium]|nr:thiamine phosphate synthase [Dehalococcoidia bacterium]